MEPGKRIAYDRLRMQSRGDHSMQLFVITATMPKKKEANGDAWKIQLVKEFKEAGFEIDANRAF